MKKMIIATAVLALAATDVNAQGKLGKMWNKMK